MDLVLADKGVCGMFRQEFRGSLISLDEYNTVAHQRLYDYHRLQTIRNVDEG